MNRSITATKENGVTQIVVMFGSENDGEMIIATDDGGYKTDEILKELRANPFMPDEELKAMFKNNLVAKLEKLEQQVAEFRVESDELFWKSNVIRGPLAERILELREKDENYLPLLRFFKKMSYNPGRGSADQLYDFLVRHGFDLTEEGNFVVWKGVQNTSDNRSITAGSNVVYVDGVPHTGYIPNPIGSVVSMERTDVDATREHQCSQGLHAGSKEYATSFGRGKVIRVEVDPYDVVSVPEDHDCAKLRTSKYLVLGEEEVWQPREFTNNYNWDDDCDDWLDELDEWFADIEDEEDDDFDENWRSETRGHYL